MDSLWIPRDLIHLLLQRPKVFSRLSIPLVNPKQAHPLPLAPLRRQIVLSYLVQLTPLGLLLNRTSALAFSRDVRVPTVLTGLNM